MSRWRLIGVGLAVYALGLIGAAPATLIDARLEQESAGRLRLAEASGTLWSGAGQLEVLDAGRQSGFAKSIAWRFLPGSLLRGQLVCEIELDQGLTRFPVTISFSRIELANADITLPASALGLAVPEIATLQLTGDMKLHVARLVIGRSGTQGNATLQWQAASSALTAVSPLGDYELRFENEGAAARASLRTLQGPLQLDGGGAWTIGAKPTLSITARVQPQQRQQLAPLLQLIGVERGDGSFLIQLR